MKTRIKTFFALSFLLVEVIIAIGLVLGLSIFWKYSTQLPKVGDLAADIRPPVATTIWSEDGVLLGSLEVENREPITLGEVPKNVVNAAVAVEDHRFYEHRGVDLQGIARAAWLNIQGGMITGQGGSTLTQQLVRNLDQFGLTKQKRIERKVQEALIAVRLEQFYSKQDILQLYLNNIYYGGGAYGIQAAAKTFFGKPVSKLTLAEGALLAGLPQRPSAFNPYEHRKAAITRRDEVLDRMLAYNYITQQQYDAAVAEKPRIKPRTQRKNFDFKAPYFTTYVINDLIKRYGASFVYSGLRIETTLNWKMQQMAEQALAEGLEKSSGYGANQGALVSIDPNCGYIRALIGGRSFHADQFNAVTQGKRQPGSTFKVFDYSAAFDTNTASLHSTYRDVPIPYPGDPEKRVVKNYSGRYSYRAMECLSAIKFSTNTIAVQVARDVGIKTVIDYAHRMGITSKLDPVLPTALGASAVRPLDLCSAYTVFPMKGNRYLPMTIVRVTDADSNLIEEPVPRLKSNLIKPETVAQMETALEAVVVSGSGTLARGTEANGIVENAHGKTGTTSDNRDAWFAGYTPELTTVIWVASVHRSGKHISYSEMQGATGGHLCAPIWHNYMIKAVPEQRKFRGPQLAQADTTDSKPVDAGNEAKPKPAFQKKNVTDPSQVKDGFQPAGQVDQNGVSPDGTTPNANPDSNAAGADNGATVPQTDLPPDNQTPNRENIVPPPAAQSSPTVPGSGLRASTPSAVPSARTASHTQSSQDMVTVTICVDSGSLANAYCDVTKSVQVTRQKARSMHRCRIHRAPPGEE